MPAEQLPDPIGQPAGDRSVAAADFEAAPARRDAARLEMTDRALVIQIRERTEACGRLRRGIVEKVRRGRANGIRHG